MIKEYHPAHIKTLESRCIDTIIRCCIDLLFGNPTSLIILSYQLIKQLCQ